MAKTNKPAAESLIDCRRYFTFNDPAHPEGIEVDNAYYRHARTGDIISHDVAAPGCGRITYRVTRIDEQGAWGVTIKSTVRELTVSDVR